MSTNGSTTLSAVEQVKAEGAVNFCHIPLSGVYFLCKEGVIMYVGQSGDVATRMKSHYLYKQGFDEVLWIACSPKDRKSIEFDWIEKLSPEWNSNPPPLPPPKQRLKRATKKKKKKKYKSPRRFDWFSKVNGRNFF